MFNPNLLIKIFIIILSFNKYVYNDGSIIQQKGRCIKMPTYMQVDISFIIDASIVVTESSWKEVLLKSCMLKCMQNMCHEWY